MNSKIIPLLIIFWVCGVSKISAQDLMNAGAPYIENFDPNSNQGTKYIWCIDQDQRGIMYFGDRNGLIEFDGSNWRLHTVPNQSSIKSIASDKNGRIYVGAINDFGFFEPDTRGILKYTSLNYLVPKEVPYFHGVWKTFITNKGVYFISNNHIFRYYNNSIEVIPAKLVFPYGFMLNGAIYLIDQELGVGSLSKNSFNPLKGCKEINLHKKELIYIDTFDNSNLFFALGKSRRLFTYNILRKELLELKLPEATQLFLNNNQIYGLLHISNEKLAIGTTKKGIIIINKEGKILQVINNKRGLISNCIFNLHLDNEKNIWAATTKGISRIDINRPSSFFGVNQGITNDVTYSAFHNKMQYIVGGLGGYLYRFPEKVENSIEDFKIEYINGFHECKHTLEINDHIILSNWYGLAEIVNNKTIPLLKGKRVFCSAYTKKYPNTIAVGKNHAIVIATFKESLGDNPIQITDTFKITQNISQVRSMEFDEQGNLWFASYNEGIFKVDFNKDDLKTYTVTRYSEANGLPKYLLGAFIGKFNGKINIFTPKGVYKPVLKDNNPDSTLFFEHDLYWGKDISRDSTAITVAKEIDKDKFFIHGDKTGILHIIGDSTYLDYKPFKKLNEIHSVSVRENRFINIGGSEYFCIYDSYADHNIDKPYNAFIRNVSIVANDSVLFNGAYPKIEENQNLLKQPKSFIPTIPNAYNSLKFEFGASFMEASSKTKFRYILEGLDKTWSPWSLETTAMYSSIPYGEYTLKVMAQNIYEKESNIASYSFKIEPAWYQTIYAYISYCILFVLFLVLIVKLYNMRLSSQNAKLDSLVKIKTQELHEAIDTLEQQKVELKNKQSEILSQNTTLAEQGKQLQNTINQLKEAQSNLVQQEKMASLGILTAGVAHEINNPLNYILGGYTGLELYFEEKQEQSEDVLLLMESIKTGVDRAADIVSGLNQFSRTKNTFDEKCDLHAILDNSILMIKHLLKNKIELTKNYRATSCDVIGNVGKLHQVFINILTNSCQAIENDGKITVETYSEGNTIVLKVIDNGEGITEENMNKITDPFFTTKAPGKGSGLGLSITYKIIQEHKGKLEYQSVIGQGTTAIINLPIIHPINGQN